MKRILLLTGLLFLMVACSSSDSPADPDDNQGEGEGQETSTIINYESLPDYSLLATSDIEAIQDSLKIYYGHTSHGRQLLEGMAMLAVMDASLTPPEIHEVLDDLGHNGDTSWADLTRVYLDNKGTKKQVVMWAWCGGVSDNTQSGIDTYLATMANLEAEYPDVSFVYMTGHLDGTGAQGTLRVLNTQIRNYCTTNNKFLFDFESIESYDPEGMYYADESDECHWCENWCATNDCQDCDTCAHSHCFNCYRKGQAFWCLLDIILDQS